MNQNLPGGNHKTFTCLLASTTVMFSVSNSWANATPNVDDFILSMNEELVRVVNAVFTAEWEHSIDGVVNYREVQTNYQDRLGRMRVTSDHREDIDAQGKATSAAAAVIYELHDGRIYVRASARERRIRWLPTIQANWSPTNSSGK